MKNNSEFDFWDFVENNPFKVALLVSTFVIGGAVTFVKGLDAYQNKVLTDNINQFCGLELQVDNSYEVMNDLVMLNGGMVYDYKSNNKCKVYILSQNVDTLPIKIDDEAQSTVYNSSADERVLITYRDNRIQMVNPRTMDTFPYYNSLRNVKPYYPSK